MLNAKQKKCIFMMAAGDMTQAKIAEKLKITEQTICNWKKNDEFNTALDEMTRVAIRSLVGKATLTMNKLLNAESESVRFAAAKDILDRAGFKAQEMLQVSGSLSTGINQLSNVMEQMMNGDR